MSRFNSLTPVAAALALTLAGTVQADTAPAKPMVSGAAVNAAQGMKEGKCGEGKCGKKGMEMGLKKGMDNGLKTGIDGKAMKEGKCGEGKCGKKRVDSKAMKEGKCGEGKCGKKLEGAAVKVDAKAAATVNKANLKATTAMDKANTNVQQGAAQVEAVKGAAGVQR